MLHFLERLYITLVGTVLLLLLLVFALFSDIKTYKIKNTIILPFILIGIIINLCVYGVERLHTVIIGIIIPIICLVPLYSLKMLGGGDIKLFSAIGAIMGHKFVISAIGFSFLSGGIIALIIMLIRKNFKKRFVYLYQYLKNCFMTLSIQPYTYINFGSKNAITEDNSGRFPFAIAVAFGTVIALLAK